MIQILDRTVFLNNKREDEHHHQPLLFRKPDRLDVFISLFLSITSGVILSLFYEDTQRGMNFESAIMPSLLLIGSLSIVRFHSAIKGALDRIFIFWAIALSLGSGTCGWSITLYEQPNHPGHQRIPA